MCLDHARERRELFDNRLTISYKLSQALLPGVQHASAPLQHDVQHEHVTKTPAQSASKTSQDGKLLGRSQTTVSKSPTNAFPLKYNVFSLESDPNSSGTAPSNRLFRRSIRLITFMLAISDGMRPSKLLSDNSSSVIDRQEVSSVGMGPSIALDAA